MKKFLLLAGIFLCLCSNLCYSAGFAVLEQSAVGSGDAYSGAVVGYGDGSEVFFNPAAMTQLEDTTFSWQVSLIKLRIDYKDHGSIDSSGDPLEGFASNGGGVIPLASAYMAHHVTDDLSLGFSFNTPYGFVIDYDKDWFGRYRADESNIKLMTFSPSMAYQVLPNLSLGANIGVSYARATLSNAIDFGSLGQRYLGDRAAALGLYPQSSDGYVELQGDDWATNFGLSALFTYGKNDRNKVGLSWRSRIVTDIEANAKFDVPENASFLQQNDIFVDTEAAAHLTFPEVITFGTQYWITDRLAIQGESAWTNWKRFNELRIKYASSQPDSVEVENWRDTWRYSAGLVYKLTDDLTFRGGWTYDHSAVYDDFRTPRVPDQNRNWMSFGLNYALTDAIELYGSYAYLFVHGAESNIYDSYGNYLLGQYDLVIQLISFGMNASF